MPGKLSLIDPEELINLRSLNLIAKFIVEGIFPGLHRSPYKGFSVEFSQHRQYFPGDELKTIDWNVYGRSDRFVIKEFEDRSNLEALILLDISKSMKYKSRKISKMRYAKMLAASLIYLLIKQRDLVGLVTFSDKIDCLIKPKGTLFHQNILFSTLENTTTSGHTEIDKILYMIGERIKRKSLIILISDLLDDPERFIVPLKGLRYKGNEVIVFWIRDPAEKKFLFKGNLSLKDPEYNRNISVLSGEVEEYFNREVKKFEKFIFEEGKKHYIAVYQANTNYPLKNLLIEFFSYRSKLI